VVSKYLLLLSSFFPCLISAIADWMSATWCGLGANLRCRPETCCTQLAANTVTQKVVKKSPSGHHCTTLLGYIFTPKARVDNWKKNLLSSNISSACSHNMVNFSPLMAEIGPVVWGIPANFNGFHILAALLHGTPVLGVSQNLWH